MLTVGGREAVLQQPVTFKTTHVRVDYLQAGTGHELVVQQAGSDPRAHPWPWKVEVVLEGLSHIHREDPDVDDKPDKDGRWAP
jgi:hypothetical protein